MAEFRGRTNLHLGVPAWAASVYDDSSRDFVITLDDEGAEKFRPLADEYGFTEVDPPVEDAKPKPKRSAKEAGE